jgi:hypothetical protein
MEICEQMIIPTSAYGKKKETVKRVKLSTQDKTRKPLQYCPKRCTQRRTPNNRLSERKTFDPSTGTCLQCGFVKINAIKPFYFKGSDFIQKGSNT